MKRFGCLIIALLFGVVFTNAQVFVPGQIVPGKRDFSLHIKNAGTTHATFFPKGTDVIAPYRHYSDSMRQIYLMSQVPKHLLKAHKTDSAKVRLSILLAGIDMVKDYHRVNRAFFVNEKYTDNPYAAYTQQHAGGLCNTAIYSQQCSNAWRELVILLIQTKWFTKSMFRTVNLQGAHSLGEVFIENWILADADPGMPVSVSRHPSAPIGYASLAAVMADTTLINERFMARIYDGSRTDAAPWCSLSTYRKIFADPAHTLRTDTTLYWLEAAMAKSNTTEITLPPGAEITIAYQSPFYLLDTSNNIGKQAYHWIKYNGDMYRKTKNEKYKQASIDTLWAYMGKPIPVDSFIVTNAAKQAPYSQQYVPTARLSIPAQAKSTQLKLPWLISSVDATGAIYYNYIIAQCETYKLWHPVNNVAIFNGQINYADAVTIPAGVALEMELAFNPTYFDWWRGFEIDPLGEADTLQVKANGMTTILTTGIQSLKQKD